MSKFISLTKVQLKDFFSKYRSSMNVGKNGFGKVLLVLLFVGFLLPASQLAMVFSDIFTQIGQPHLGITYMYIMSVLMIFISGIPFVVSIFFYAKDLKFLASLPISERTIIFSKLASVYVYLLAFAGLFFAPSLVIYGVQNGFTPSLVIFGLIALVLTPALPLAISALIILPAMRLVASSRRRNLYSILGGIAFVIFILLLQTFIVRQQTSPESFQQIFMQENGLLHFIGKRFPPSVWMTQMILGSLVDAVLFILLNVALFAILAATAKVFYKRALVSFNQESTVVSGGKIYFLQRSKHLQLVRRHIMIILKQPTFFLNTAMSIVVPVILFVVMILTGEASLSVLQAPELAPFVGLIYAAILCSPTLIANISATAITREGKAFWETKVFPISTEENIRARIHTTLFFCFLGSLLLGITALFLMPVTPLQILLAALVCVTVTLFFATVDITVNIMRPYLEWTNPTAAVKNNLNVIISLLLRVIVGGLLFLIFKTSAVDISDPVLIPLLLSGFFFVLYLGARYVVYHPFVKRFNQIQA